MDELDIRIYEELQEDGRKNFTEIAKVLGVSETTIRKRVRDMRKSKIIHIGAYINPPKIGYKIVSIVGFNLNVPELKQFVNELKNNTAVRYVAFVGGRYDVIAMIFSRSPEELSHFLRYLYNKTKITHAEAFVNLEIIKTPWLQAYNLRSLIDAKAYLTSENTDWF